MEFGFSALKALQRYGGEASVDLMLMPQNADAIAKEFYEFKERLPGKSAVTLGVLYASGRETGEHLFPRRADLEAALTQIAFESGVAIRGQTPSPTAYWRDGCDCAVGLNLNVRSDGGLYRCYKMAERVGHLRTEGLLRTARALRKKPLLACELPACADCPLATLCGGGCRSDNRLHTGDANHPPCGPWRVRVISELLAEDRTEAVRWLAPQLLGQLYRRVTDARHRARHMRRNSNGSTAVLQGPCDRLTDPPRGIGGESEASTILEFVHRAHQANVALLNQVRES